MIRHIPTAPDTPLRFTEWGGLVGDELRNVNTLAWMLRQRGIDPCSIEWPGWGYVPTETAGAALLTDIELARLAFYRHEYERGAIGEWTVTP